MKFRCHSLCFFSFHQPALSCSDAHILSNNWQKKLFISFTLFVSIRTHLCWVFASAVRKFPQFHNHHTTISSCSSCQYPSVPVSSSCVKELGRFLGEMGWILKVGSSQFVLRWWNLRNLITLLLSGSNVWCYCLRQGR
jgi:hypothetical protein